MAYCTQCGTKIPDGTTVCPNCGTDAAQIPVPAYTQPYVDPKDHTAEFDKTDISNNKVFAMCAYLLGMAGLVIAVLAGKESPYVLFHVRQALKIDVCGALLTLLSLVLCWTVIVPLVCCVGVLVLLVVKIIMFFQICSSLAKEAPIVSNFGFLK